jgi:hypothetical protein
LWILGKIRPDGAFRCSGLCGYCDLREAHHNGEDYLGSNVGGKKKLDECASANDKHGDFQRDHFEKLPILGMEKRLSD